MCGIAGIYYFNNQKVHLEQLKKMSDVLSYRGPDGDGHWINDEGNLGFGHRRLSIIDLDERSSQPMHYMERYSITYNGEIYNYLELKSELQKKGYKFKTESDTEVLLAAYAEYKEKMFPYLDGMFAFAIWDNHEKKLFCTRDRFGEKPFYYYADKFKFIFASEMKALFKIGIEQNKNFRMLFDYLAYDVVENPWNKSETFFHKIHKLEASHYLDINSEGKIEKKRYWDIDLSVQNYDISHENAADKFKELFIQSVKRRLRSDVPVGTSLSGGLDSSSIVCIMDSLIKGSGQIQKTFSARFNHPDFDEGKYINFITQNASVLPFEVWPDQQTFLNTAEKLYYHFEEPLLSSSMVVQWAVMNLVKENNVTVLLDGQGGDEILAGYPFYYNHYFSELYVNNKLLFNKELNQYKNLYGHDFIINKKLFVEAQFPKIVGQLGKLKRKLFISDDFSDLNKNFISEYYNINTPFEHFNNLNSSLKFSTMQYGLGKLLKNADRTSMSVSREVRLPFLNHDLVEFLFSLPSHHKIRDGYTKRILRDAMNEYLPNEIAWRTDKKGFWPPQDEWMHHKKVSDWVNHYSNLLKENKIISKINDNKRWQYIMAGMFFEKYFSAN